MAFVWERARETIFYTHSYCFRSNINHWLAHARFWGSSFVRVYERIAIVCGGAINFDKYYLLNAITQIHSTQTHNPTGADHKRLYWALHGIAASRRRRDMMVGDVCAAARTEMSQNRFRKMLANIRINHFPGGRLHKFALCRGRSNVFFFVCKYWTIYWCELLGKSSAFHCLPICSGGWRKQSQMMGLFLN